MAHCDKTRGVEGGGEYTLPATIYASFIYHTRPSLWYLLTESALWAALIHHCVVPPLLPPRRRLNRHLSSA